MTIQLIDPFLRRIDYVRISVTDRCDLRCNYCMPVGFTDFEEPKDWLTFDELEAITRAFADLGVGNIRITGGEPLLRKNLAGLIGRLSNIDGIKDISLSTNATQLAKHAKELKLAGLNRLNVSLDSVNRQRFSEVCGRDSLQQVLEGLEVAKQVNLAPIKINSVYMPDTTDEQVDALVSYCINQGFILRFIEVMPVGDTGRKVGSSNVITLKNRLQNRFGLIESIEKGPGPAKYLISVDQKVKIGFITPMSQHFCETCNRIRLSVDGTLYMCLGQDAKFDLKPYLRQGASHSELMDAIRKAITLKPERHEFNEFPEKIIRIMARTGG